MLICQELTLQDENLNGILFSNLDQISQIHGIKYEQIMIFELKLYKLSLKDF